MRLLKQLRSFVIGICFSLCSLGVTQEAQQTIKDALARGDAAVAAIIAVPNGQRTFENTLGAFDDMDVRLDNDTSLILFMQYVSTDANERDASRAAEEMVTNWYIEMGKREDLYKAIKAYADTKPNLEGEEKRMLEFTMRDYRRAGMDLAASDREKLKEIEKELSKLGIEFDQKIAEDNTRVPLLISELKGVPKDTIDRQERAADVILYKLDAPSYGALMDYCQVPLTREKAWVSYRRRGGTENIRTLERLIKLRAQAANMLGYDSTVDYEIETRMAKTDENVAKFYKDLQPIVRKKALLDFEEFQNEKRKHIRNSKAEFKQWDYSFYKTRLLKNKYSVDSEKVAEYFPMERVVNGLFSITSTLYGIDYRDVTSKAKDLGLPIWHADVKLYEVWDKEKNELLGRLYTDLYPRENKYNHAACWGLRPRKVNKDGSVQTPLAALVCNFTKPTADKPSLLPHDEVETFFHEFGHGLHQILTNTRLGRFSGTKVARDFVEAPSQMMENWVWSPEVLKTFAKQYKTGEPLPDKMLEGMKKARTLGSGLETEGQFYLGLMDQAYHTAPGGDVDSTQVGNDVYGKVLLYKPVPMTYFQASFGHLVGYEGAYYGYLWSLVYAQDMFQRFEELGLLSPKAGQYYREKILGRGGAMDEMDMLEDYLGRKPNMKAFLRHLGLEEK
ncbi:MAG: Zn-dependent oligopeptidase [Armatimonadetes bacterium]|nr:Zn-dependent oligopeptidase [Armatimonadota bacterium]